MSKTKEIAALNDAMCVADVALENLDGGLQSTPYQRSLIALAAEVRRLREENKRQRFDILAMNQSLDLMREENEKLWMTFVKTADVLDIDTEAERKTPGAPSGVFIREIERLRKDMERLDWLLSDFRMRCSAVFRGWDGSSDLRSVIDAARGVKLP